MIDPEASDRLNDVLLTPAGATDVCSVGGANVENRARIKGIGYVASKHITMYGERFELVSDPVQEGDCIVVQAICENDPTIRALRLPVLILLGLSDRRGQKMKFGKKVR